MSENKKCGKDSYFFYFVSKVYQRSANERFFSCSHNYDIFDYKNIFNR